MKSLLNKNMILYSAKFKCSILNIFLDKKIILLCILDYLRLVFKIKIHNLINLHYSNHGKAEFFNYLKLLTVFKVYENKASGLNLSKVKIFSV